MGFVGWIDNEIDLLLILLTVQVEHLTVVDNDVGLDQFSQRFTECVRHCLALGSHFLSNLLALALLGCEIVAARPLLGFDDKQRTLGLPNRVDLLLDAHGKLAVERVAAQEGSFATSGVLLLEDIESGLRLEGCLCFDRVHAKQRTNAIGNIHQLCDIVLRCKCLAGQEDHP